MKVKSILLLRADGNVEMGAGHLMRMLALAQAWRAGGREAVFVCAEVPQSVTQRLNDEGFLVRKINGAPGSADDLKASIALTADYIGRNLIFVLDGYQFNAEFQRAVREVVYRLVVFDDYGHSAFYHADWVVNPNISATKLRYQRRSSKTHLLLGQRFIVLRREFVEHDPAKRKFPEVARNILVTLGGSDPNNVTEEILGALDGSDFPVKVGMGGSNPHLDRLRTFATRANKGTTHFELLVNVRDMPSLMLWADFAITAGGSTVWEMAYFGLPSIIVVTARNQVESVGAISKAGFAHCITKFEELEKGDLRKVVEYLVKDKAHRERISVAGQAVVDGKGGYRLCEVLESDSLISLHPVDEVDFQLIWGWANDHETRKNSFDSADIPWEAHVEWCLSKMRDPHCRFWLAKIANHDNVACVRIDRLDEKPTISIVVSGDERGNGYGRQIIRAACLEVFSECKVDQVYALIKPGNLASVRSFEAVGFEFEGEVAYKSQPALCYVFRQKF